jgi:hypothetical protein
LPSAPLGDVCDPYNIGIDLGRWVVAMFNSAIHISSMAHMDNGDGLLRIVNIVEHPIIPNPQAPSFSASQLSRTLWTWLMCECEYGFSKSLIGFGRKGAQFPLGTGENA